MWQNIVYEPKKKHKYSTVNEVWSPAKWLIFAITVFIVWFCNFDTFYFVSVKLSINEIIIPSNEVFASFFFGPIILKMLVFCVCVYILWNVYVFWSEVNIRSKKTVDVVWSRLSMAVWIGFCPIRMLFFFFYLPRVWLFQLYTFAVQMNFVFIHHVF